MWDHLFEAGFQSRSTESFMREFATYCFFSRRDTPPEWLVFDGTNAREEAMAAAIAEERERLEPGQKILIVTGGFHTVVLPQLVAAGTKRSAAHQSAQGSVQQALILALHPQRILHVQLARRRQLRSRRQPQREVVSLLAESPIATTRVRSSRCFSAISHMIGAGRHVLKRSVGPPPPSLPSRRYSMFQVANPFAVRSAAIGRTRSERDRAFVEAPSFARQQPP